MDKRDKKEENYKAGKTITGGLIAINLIILQSLISLSINDNAIFIAIISFAIAIPLLVSYFWMNEVEYENRERETSPIAKGLSAVTVLAGMIITIVGIASVMWHMSRIAGIIFIVSSIAALLTNYKHWNIITGGKLFD